jgi:hypothetical protein
MASRLTFVGTSGEWDGSVPEVMSVAAEVHCRLRALLARREVNGREAAKLISGMIQLEPVVPDLSTWHDWAVPPTSGLLAAARQNLTLDDWLTALPSFSG